MNWIKFRLHPTIADDPESDANLRTLHMILVILIIVTGLAGIYYLIRRPGALTGVILLSSLPCQIISLALAHRKKARASNYLSLVTIYILSNILLITADGLGSIVILFYPVLLLSSGLLLSRREFFGSVGLVILSVILVASAQLLGLIQPIPKTPDKVFNDMLMVLLILSITSVVIFLLSENVRNSLRQAKSNQQALSKTNNALQQEIVERRHVEAIRHAIYRISEAAQNTPNLTELYISIHNIICELMPAHNFYISLYDPETDLITTPYLSDQFRENWPPYKPGKGLAAYVLRTGETLLLTPEEYDRMEKAGEVEILLKRMVDWLGVPLKTSSGIIGVMVVQTYQPNERLTETDKNVLMFVSTQVATVIERRNAEEERQKLIYKLENQNAELERFTYTVSHDLKSPLITIRGFADYLRRDLDAGDTERVRQDLDRISQSAERMQELLGDLLELSRIGRLVNPPEAVPFQVIVEEALALLQGSIQARGVRLVCNQELPVIFGDRARLVEVVQNLVENAIKFMGKQMEPCIQIGAQDKTIDDMPVFYVRDNGMGIEPQYHEKIFGLFEKLDARGEGTGIGLALVKRIIEVHGGMIWVESYGVGQGSTFYFTLPAAQVKIPSYPPSKNSPLSE
jgi:signal transduction histidine kinase